MHVFFATDHAGFELKEVLLAFVRDELGYEVRDFGAYEYDEYDDYPDFVIPLAKAISDTRDGVLGIVLGASGQGEAMVANRFEGVRAAVFYGESAVTQTDVSGEELGMLASTRQHNNANVLSIGARFVDAHTAKTSVRTWLAQSFNNEERHLRRIAKIDRAINT